MHFYLGAHQPHFLKLTDVPLFVSRRTLSKYKEMPRALGRWALDSGGFTEIKTFGKWSVSSAQYVNEVRRFRDEVGGMDWAAIQDWMCEPFMLKRTGLTIKEHQLRTLRSYMVLKSRAPEVIWAPVLQGWRLADYARHIEMYEKAGVQLATLPIVGVGSVCRRQHTTEVEDIMRFIAGLGIRIHGFGVKTQGIERYAKLMTSLDSMAWSFTARRQKVRLPGHTHTNCANCLEYALQWREKIVSKLEGARLAA